MALSPARLPVPTSSSPSCPRRLSVRPAWDRVQDFGRVQALVIVFSRIVDIESFSEVVLSAVMEEEKRELQHRLGVLNVLNPVRVSAVGSFLKVTRG